MRHDILRANATCRAEKDLVLAEQNMPETYDKRKHSTNLFCYITVKITHCALSHISA